MKIISIILSLSIYIYASEFAYIQPIAVEDAQAVDINISKVDLSSTKKTDESQEFEDEQSEEFSEDMFENSIVADSEFEELLDTDKEQPEQQNIIKAFFAKGKYNVSDRLVQDLEEYAEYLKENKAYQIVIYGYTDDVGSEESNKKLSQNRANSVKKVLVDYGVKKIRLTAIGMGEKNPIADNSTQEGRAKNRRIEVDLL